MSEREICGRIIFIIPSLFVLSLFLLGFIQRRRLQRAWLRNRPVVGGTLTNNELSQKTGLIERIEQGFQTGFRSALECRNIIGVLRDCEVGFNALGYTQGEITQDPAWKGAKNYTLTHLKRVHADCSSYLENVEALARILEIKRYVGIAMSLCNKCSAPKVEGEDFRCAVLEVLSKLDRN